MAWHGTTSLLLLLLVASLAASALHAQNQFKQVRQEVAELSRKLTEADTALADANRKVADNRKAQEDAQKNAPSRLPALKSEGVRLAEAAARASENRQAARSALASKQGEMRGAASKHAVDQLAAQGNINTRVTEITHALDAWKEALGPLPEVPQLRNAADPDPEVVKAMKEGDRRRLRAFDDWAAAEETRLKTELERVDKLVGADAQVKQADDGKMMVDTAKALRETLKARQRQVADLRREAAARLRKLA